MSYTVICPYCNKEATFMSSKDFYGTDYGTNLYVCKPCDARVGAHKNTSEPLGTMANAMLRQVRMDAHKLVDPIWKNPFNSNTRSVVYKAISSLMNIPIEETHIGMFDYGKCQAVMYLVRNGEIEAYLKEQNALKRQKKKERRQKELSKWKDENPGQMPDGTSEIPIPSGEKLFGMYSTVSKKFVFGIQEPSKSKAYKQLFDRIGKDAYKYRFEVRKLKRYIIPPEEVEVQA